GFTSPRAINSAWLFMCLLAILYRTVRDAEVLVAANREEFFNRPTLPPKIIEAPNIRVGIDCTRLPLQSIGPVRNLLCGRDARAGGTWLGVNDRGVVVAVTNRRKSVLPSSP